MKAKMLLRFGDEWVKSHNLSSLRVLGSVGEPLNQEAWQWFHQVVGGGQCDLVDILPNGSLVRKKEPSDVLDYGEFCIEPLGDEHLVRGSYRIKTCSKDIYHLIYT